MNRFVSVKDRYLVFSSDRNGALAPFQVDLHTGTVRALANATHLDPASLCLDPKERWLYFLDGDQLMRTEIAKNAKRQNAEKVAEGVGCFSIAPNGTIFFTRKGDLLRRLADDAGDSMLVASGAGKICRAQTAAGQGCLFTRETGTAEHEFWYAPAGTDKPVLLAKGAVSNPFWSPDGQSILFLRDVPRENVTLSEIHEVGIDGKMEQCIAPTSQFAAFSPNFDASVFVGASRSKAQPNVVLLLRSAKREMTLCQHHASNAAAVSPTFSPDARRVYFQSDEDGKPALYSVNVEMLVEPPGENSEV